MNIYSPNEDIVRAGEKIRGAILVSRGEILVLKGGVTERKMKRLDRFAQDCLFVDKASVYDENPFSIVLRQDWILCRMS